MIAGTASGGARISWNTSRLSSLRGRGLRQISSLGRVDTIAPTMSNNRGKGVQSESPCAQIASIS